MKDKKGQDEQTEPLILENVNNIGSRRVSYSQYFWRFLVGIDPLTIITKSYCEKLDQENP